MPATLFGREATGTYVLSEAQLRKFTGRGAMHRFLEYLATGDACVIFDDFTTKALNTTNDYSVAAGATATTWAINGQANGVIRGATGTTAATSGLHLLLNATGMGTWTGARSCGIEVMWQTSDITELRFEVGFGATFPAVNTVMVATNIGSGTPTFNTTADGMVYLYNHTGSTTTMGLFSIGTGITAQRVNNTIAAPVNATFQRVSVQTNGQHGFVQVNGVTVARIATGIVAATAMYPIVAIKNNSTTSQNIDLDYIRIWQNR